MCKNIILGFEIVFLSVFSYIAFADWDGSFEVIYTGKQSIPKVVGQMRMKKNQIRIDSTAPAQVSTLVNLKLKKAWTLLHAQKMLMETNVSNVEAYTQFCETSEIEACLKKRGFKKLGSESIQGHKCDIYESETKTDGKTRHERFL
ncbi:MAG: DUF4412 domain-containing protein [Deltaproteobacteria bacterium]|nr:DUF4412 domain-containing protein [Deltaproteobacteria bacterium]